MLLDLSMSPFFVVAQASDDGGLFGDWINDMFDLPAYNYTCNQLSNPADNAYTEAMQKAGYKPWVKWDNGTDHRFLFGNRRLTVCQTSRWL
jgi:hypothetical protein